MLWFAPFNFLALFGIVLLILKTLMNNYYY